jgi:hypothetical protein
MKQEDAAAMFLPVSCFEDEDEGEDDGGDKKKPNVRSSAASGGSEKTSIRILRPDLSIRKGKYGPYIFHKSTHMQTPKFYPLKPLKDKWQSMPNLELIAAIENTYHISI